MAFTRLRRAAALVLCAVALFGCTPQPAPTSLPPQTASPTPTPSSTPSATPTLSPDQQAAVQRVADYFATLNAVLLDERSPNELAKVARGNALADAQTSYNELKNAGYTVSGFVVVRDLRPSAPTSKGSRASISVSFCQDSTGREVTDKSGKVVVSGTVAAVVATVQQWTPDWFVTAFNEGGATC